MNENQLYQIYRTAHVTCALAWEEQAVQYPAWAGKFYGWAAEHWDKAGLSLNANACKVAAG